ncbi:hypothetical protein ACFOW1_13850 [Parasediminibacterium paludis]|uniref:Uncharacterized protein n=1 Tax=Parasediminibacterium paludis TaxID=908966 RepID=A0ABV8Q0E5_9BACT
MKQPKQLTKADEEFCAVAGVAGVVLAIACLFQNLYISPGHWITLVVTAIFLFSITAFVLLVRKSTAAFLCVCISALLLFSYLILLIIAIFVLQLLIFSWIFMILLVYNITIAIVIFAKDIPSKLVFRKQTLLAEEAYWNEKL